MLLKLPAFVMTPGVVAKTERLSLLEINLYDSNGQQLGSTLANLNNLEAGQVWNYKAPITEDNVAKYKIMKVTGF